MVSSKFRTALRSAAIALLMLLMGMGSPQCTQSEIPLGSPQDGFVDHYLIGEWQGPNTDEPGPNGEFTIEADGETELVFALDGPQQLRVYWENKEFVGYSTWLNGNKYLNLRMVDCHDCDEEERTRLNNDTCPYQIVRYWTYMPKFLLANEPDEDIAAIDKAVKANAGRMLFIGLMLPRFVKEQIEAAQITGEESCETCFWKGACLRASGDELRQFVKEHDLDLYTIDEPGVYVRAEKIQ
jgi:hypothetical protein